jgi:DNA-binding response OmpR family regulator
MKQQRPARLLLAEDSPDDLEILRRALTKAAFDCELRVARDGQEVMTLLLDGDRPAAPPDLIVLDLNMPKLNGLEVLERIRSGGPLSLVPVVMLTVSSRYEDVAQSYRLGANTYLQKPAEFNEMVRLLEVLDEYWFRMAKLPSLVA